MKKRMTIQDKAETAIKKAVDKVIENRTKQSGSVKVSKEAIKEMNTENAEHFIRGNKEYIISKYNSKRYFVIVSEKPGNVIPIFPFFTKQEALDYIDKQAKRSSK